MQTFLTVRVFGPLCILFILNYYLESFATRILFNMKIVQFFADGCMFFQNIQRMPSAY